MLRTGVFLESSESFAYECLLLLSLVLLQPATGAMAFVDLAQCSLKAIKDESLYGKNLYVDYKKKE